MSKKGKEITHQKQVNNELFDFYNNLNESDKRRPKHDKSRVLLRSSLPSLNFHIWRWPYLCIKEYAKNKSPGNDGLTNKFRETFWNELKIPFMASLRKSFLKEELSISQKQAVIRITGEKKQPTKTKIEGLSKIGDHYLC